MDWHDMALAAAGAIGGVTAVVHGVLTQRLMVRPIEAAIADRDLSRPIRRLVPALLQFSTFAWLVGGLALVVAAWCSHPEAKLATGLIVGSLYLYGALGNGWATRWRHPGWMLMAIAVVLIALGLSGR